MAFEKGDGWFEERTGLDEDSFIETRRHWFTKKITHNTNAVVNVLKLIEGREAIVESPINAFEPFIIHYAETFIVPAAVGEYTIRPHGEGRIPSVQQRRLTCDVSVIYFSARLTSIHS